MFSRKFSAIGVYFVETGQLSQHDASSLPSLALVDDVG